ncbi:MAG TPA: LuxR C-terminal-related transcriptional regulator [Candidatus Elarobacter sp.]|nr:LuxR C-terminal-related transcriptional regulator [Candidatus Elarobacter sp.]
MIRSVAADGRPDLGGAFRPIDRPRVLDRLRNAARYRIAAIIAPAGFGKSVAVRQFLETLPSAVLYDVPPDATTLAPFVLGFADALAAAVPAVRRSVVTALDAARASKTPGRDLATWLTAHVRELDMLIAIDDVHVAEGDAEVSRFLTALLERTKGGPRWLLASRSPLQLPVASWLAYGESDLVVDAVDLRFTVEEAKASARATRVAVRDDELEQMLAVIDGWPAALTFALRTSTRASDLRAVSAGTREMVYRYLAEQVWHALDERTRAFLRTAAFLPRLETRLAVAAGFDDAAAIIESLRERVAFVSVLDAGVYKLHDLFRDFVQRQVALDGDEALRAAQLSSARLLERMGMEVAALERFAEARDAADVERVLARENFTLLDRGGFDVVERALRTLPSGASLANPRVLALRAALEEGHGRTDQAERWYAAALKRVEDDVPVAVRVATRYALLVYQRARRDAIPVLEALRARDDLGTTDRADVLGVLAISEAHTGRPAEAGAAIGEALAIAELGDDALRARTLLRAATTSFFAGDDEDTERYAREGSRLATELADFGLAARGYATLTALNSTAGRIAAAAWYAAQVAANAEKAGDPLMRVIGLRSLISLEAERGNAARVEELDRELERLAYRGPAALIAHLYAKAIHAAWNGRFADAQRLLATPADRDFSTFHSRVRWSVLAVVSAKLGDRKAAIGALERFDRAVADDVDEHATYARWRGLTDRYAVLANLLLERNAAAQKAMRGLRSDEPDLRAFDAALGAIANRVPEQFDAALAEMRQAGVGGIAAFADALAREVFAARAKSAPEALTPVELHVLRSMSQGLGNQAIADEQQRTVNTIRTHVSSILRKLGCANRGEAVAEARRRHLV